jgi:hypothetical protein
VIIVNEREDDSGNIHLKEEEHVRFMIFYLEREDDNEKITLKEEEHEAFMVI